MDGVACRIADCFSISRWTDFESTEKVSLSDFLCTDLCKLLHGQRS